MKVYIAAPFFNPIQLDLVKNIESILKENGIKFFSPRYMGTLKDMTPEEQANSHETIYNANINNMNECTHMVAIVQEKDTGTIFEMGYFAAQRKDIVMYTEQMGTVNVMLGQAAVGVASYPLQVVQILLGDSKGEDIEDWT